MYVQQKLLRIKNHIDVFALRPCDKCNAIIQPVKEQSTSLYVKSDVLPIRDYYKKVNFMSAEVFLDDNSICHINILDNKVKVLHAEFFRIKDFIYDDNIYLLPFLKILNTYRKNDLPSSLKKLLIAKYNEFLIKAVQSTSNTKNAVYGRHIANYNPPTILQNLFENNDIEINNSIKDFVSESFYEKHQGKILRIIIKQNSTETFLDKYKSQDKDNYLSWVIIDDFTSWYVKNYSNYKNYCMDCFGKKEMRRSSKVYEVLVKSFNNKEITELRKLW